nr:hypothetical protein [Tanacetum cinerariifolium]GFB54499.1 hypothetical protein [Tanacetum cinerariifolium]
MYVTTVSHLTILSTFICTESIKSSVASAILPYHVPVASDSKPMEAPTSLMIFDFEYVEPSLKLEPFSGCNTPVGFAVIDPDDELLGSPDTADYYGGSEFSKDELSEDGSIDASSRTDESLPAQAAPAIAPESPPALYPPITLYRPREAM